ncbi:hypothetical protein QJQ45_015914 [Haematococcus lacustris]|nr:hypothetical protein QJQ45_015914 [Haematococcus lacustris]
MQRNRQLKRNRNASDIEVDRELEPQPGPSQAQKNKKASGEARRDRHDKNTWHAKKAKRHTVMRGVCAAGLEAGAVVASEVVEARVVTQLEAWVEACSMRALLGSLLLGLAVRGWFTRVRVLPDGQEVFEEIPAELAALLSWPAMWAEMSKARWSNARFRLYGGKQRTVAKFWAETVKGAKVRCNSAATGRPLALAYGAAGFSGSGSIGSKGVPVKQMQREACKQFPGRVVLVHEFRTSRVSSARTNVVQGQAESFRWLYPVRSMAKRSRIRGLMCSTSNVIKRRFYDRDVSAALNIARIAAGPGRPRELSSWLGRPAMPNPGRPGQEWVQVRDRGLRRKWQRRHQRQRYCGLWLQLGQLGGDMSSLCPTFGGNWKVKRAAAHAQLKRSRVRACSRFSSTSCGPQAAPCSRKRLAASHPGLSAACRRGPLPPRSSSTSSGNNNNNNSWDFAAWLRKLPLGRIAWNLACLFALTRIWPVGGHLPPRAGSSSSLGGEGSAAATVAPVPFSDFVRRARCGDLQTVSVDGQQLVFSVRRGSPLLQKVEGAGGGGEAPGAGAVLFHTTRPADYPLPYELLEKHDVVFTALSKPDRHLGTILVGVAGRGGAKQRMYCVYLGLMLAALNRLPLRLPNQKGPGRRHKAGGEGERPATTFADVAGVDEAKEELAELVDYLKAPERFMKLGARPPSGVLLVGPPGTGKTLLAKAVAGEAGVPFFSIAASEFVELYVGVGALRVRELFAAARKEAPAIVFIDEIDAVAKGRDSRMRGAGNDEREQTLNQLLTELDGFDSDKDGGGAVICLAATNRAEVLDPALLRPGRFDRRVPVERPDRQGRTQILQVHLSRRGLPLAPDVSVSGLAASTTGFTGADLANLVNEAALLAGRHSRSQVTAADFDAAVMRAVAGLEKKRGIMVAAEREVVARHEAGHALAASAVQQLLPLTAAGVERLSIIPRSGGALGFTYMPPKTEDRALLFDSEIRGQLVVLMGGRAAEQLTCTAVSTGAADDIRRATDLAQRAVSEFGLSLAVGPLNVGVLAAGGAEDAGLWGALGNSGGGGVPGLVETEVKALLDEALSCALDVIRVNASAHDGLSRALSSAERLEGPELARWLDQVAVPDSLRSFVQSRGVGQNASFTAKLQAQQS